MRLCDALLAGVVLGLMLGGCGSAPEAMKAEKAAGKTASAPPGFESPIRVATNGRADVLFLLEQASRWRRDIPRDFLRELEDKVGLYSEGRQLLRKFALVRNELFERQKKLLAKPTFDAPLGPSGIFPEATDDLASRFWNAVLGSPAQRVGQALSGLMESQDAELVSRAVAHFGPKAAKLMARDEQFAGALRTWSAKLRSVDVWREIERFCLFAGVSPGGLSPVVVPVWAPRTAPLQATAYGGTVVVTVPDGEQPGPAHALLALHEIGRMILARMPAADKVRLTRLVVETAGYRGSRLDFTEALLDAFSHGWLAQRLGWQSAGARWPGDEKRRRYAGKLAPLLASRLRAGGRLDAAFVLEAADLMARTEPPRPSDFVTGAMVFGSTAAIDAFRAGVVRWLVWRFPIERKYDYRRKLEKNAGRSVLCILTPRDLKKLYSLVEQVGPLKAALRKAAVQLTRGHAVIVAEPRKLRGYYFVVAAPSPQKMKAAARAFFSLKSVPTGDVVVKD